MSTQSAPPQAASLEHIRRLAGEELSLRTRVGHVALLLAAAIMTAVVVALWVTEPSLPVRTQAAFGVLAAIGASWAAFAAWVLSRRRPLFARDRVIAGRMAVMFTTVFVVAAVGALFVTRGTAALAMLGSAIGMLALALATLRGAQRRFAALAARRQALEAEARQPLVGAV